MGKTQGTWQPYLWIAPLPHDDVSGIVRVCWRPRSQTAIDVTDCTCTSHLAPRTSHIRRVRQLLYATSDGRLRLSHCNDSTDTATATATATARRAKHQLAYSPDLTQIVYTYHGNVCIKVCHLSNLDIGEHKKLFTVKDIYKLPN